MIYKNRLLYHTKQNGVGTIQGFCECMDEKSHPCRIIRDLLDITPNEIESWKTTGEWSWAHPKDKLLGKKSIAKANYEYEKNEIALCEQMRKLKLESKTKIEVEDQFEDHLEYLIQNEGQILSLIHI